MLKPEGNTGFNEDDPSSFMASLASSTILSTDEKNKILLLLHLKGREGVIETALIKNLENIFNQPINRIIVDKTHANANAATNFEMIRKAFSLSTELTSQDVDGTNSYEELKNY